MNGEALFEHVWIFLSILSPWCPSWFFLISSTAYTDQIDTDSVCVCVFSSLFSSLLLALAGGQVQQTRQFWCIHLALQLLGNAANSSYAHHGIHGWIRMGQTHAVERCLEPEQPIWRPNHRVTLRNSPLFLQRCSQSAAMLCDNELQQDHNSAFLKCCTMKPLTCLHVWSEDRKQTVQISLCASRISQYALPPFNPATAILSKPAIGGRKLQVFQ